MIVFASETGLRPAELAALEHRDIDRAAGIVHVRRVVAGGRTKEPKTRTEPTPGAAHSAGAIGL